MEQKRSKQLLRVLLTDLESGYGPVAQMDRAAVS